MGQELPRRELVTVRCLEHTHGLGDRHCQKLYGRCASRRPPSEAPANGSAASPPLEDGGGRWSSAILSRMTCTAIMMKAWTSRLPSKRSPGHQKILDGRAGQQSSHARQETGEGADLSRDATSMIKGVSSEKPALDLFRRIAMAWSLYERMGDRIRNDGVR